MKWKIAFEDGEWVVKREKFGQVIIAKDKQSAVQLKAALERLAI